VSAEAFFALHSGHAHEAPGSRADTLRALALSGKTGRLAVLDLGCGPGAASLALLEALPEALVTGLDLHPPFVEAAIARIAAAGHGDRFRGVVSDMAAPPAAPGSVDLLWSEGAAYSIGLGHALALWRPLLKPGGVLAFSELVWLTDRPAPEAQAFFASEYPPMTDAAGVRDLLAKAGYRLRGDFLVSRAGWEAYYLPLAQRCDALEAELGPEEPALVETRAEIDIWRRHGADFGYGFFVAEPLP
jgi:SAM-dependent methyltransferase